MANKLHSMKLWS